MDSATIRVHGDFLKLVEDYVARFYKKYNVRMSTVEATRKIKEKIDNAGGLVV
jgi:hypothetical protein